MDLSSVTFPQANGEKGKSRYICEAETVSYAWVLVHVEVRWP